MAFTFVHAFVFMGISDKNDMQNYFSKNWVVTKPETQTKARIGISLVCIMKMLMIKGGISEAYSWILK